MKRILKLIACILLLSSPVSCGVNAHNSLAEVPLKCFDVDVPEMEMVIYKDDHKKTRKNADEIFFVWADEYDLRRMLRSKQLVAIIPKEDEVTITYNYTPFNGELQRVTFHVFHYRQTYRKNKK